MLTTPLLARPAPKPAATRPFRPPHCPWPRCDTRPRAPFRYYLKRPELLVPVAAGLVAGSAHRQLARSLRCAPATVTRLGPRLGRHALLFMARVRPRLGPPREPLVYDDFETFFGAQDFAVGLGTAVGQPLTTPAPAPTRSRRPGPHPGA
jgi:hypothetical protein